MDRLDTEIMKAILIEEKSMYRLEKSLKENGTKSNYATVWRHIKRMQKEGLLTVIKALRRNGKLDKRQTEITTLTPKGLATLMIEGDLQKEELAKIGLRSFQHNFSNLPLSAEPFMTDVFSEAILKMKPKVSLKYFDEKWFKEIYRISILEAGKEAMQKYEKEFQKKGIWATDEENEKAHRDIFDRIFDGEDIGQFFSEK
jgi:DNA-binding PadR family transcriptional regulator